MKAIALTMAVLLNANAYAQGSDDRFSRLPVPTSPLNEYVLGYNSTTFSLWAPEADSVRINLYKPYKNGREGALVDVASMTPSDDGTWQYHASKRLENYGYTFQTCYSGKWQKPTVGIFAKAVGINGHRAYAVNMRDTDPQGWTADAPQGHLRPDQTVIYEMHHRDFSADESSGMRYKGKYLALTETGTRNKEGLPTGIDHLKQLGVTHIHLLPSFDYASVDESKRNSKQYNWGYDPQNYNVPEGSYSTDPADPECRIREFKRMVKSLHDNGFRVVLDVVYNHTFDVENSNFQLTAPDYFYRHNPDGSLANGSGCGNETASERPMMRKFMIESVLYWIREYHIDGFRFDLMGIHDIQTMREIRRAVDAVNPEVIIYGEGWAAGAPQLPEERLAMKANMKEINGVAAFGDELRDALRGPWDNDAIGAFIIGRPGNEESIKFGIVGAIEHPQVDCKKVNYSKKAWANQPTQMISYVSCHDDMCLADRLKATKPASSNEERERLAKLAETAVLLGEGIPFIFAGDEIMRDKKGVHNSYNSPDSVNCIAWGKKTAHKDVFDYLCQIISIRRQHPAFHLNADDIRENLRFLPVKQKNIVAYTIKASTGIDENGKEHFEQAVVILNANTSNKIVNVPKMNYTVLARNGKADADNGLGSTKGGRVKVEAQSALVLCTASTQDSAASK